MQNSKNSFQFVCGFYWTNQVSFLFRWTTRSRSAFVNGLSFFGRNLKYPILFPSIERQLANGSWATLCQHNLHSLLKCERWLAVESSRVWCAQPPVAKSRIQFRTWSSSLVSALKYTYWPVDWSRDQGRSIRCSNLERFSVRLRAEGHWRGSLTFLT